MGPCSSSTKKSDQSQTLVNVKKFSNIYFCNINGFRRIILKRMSKRMKNK